MVSGSDGTFTADMIHVADRDLQVDGCMKLFLVALRPAASVRHGEMQVSGSWCISSGIIIDT